MRTFYPPTPTRRCSDCGATYTRQCSCMARRFSGDVPTCEAPGCTREIGASEHLCQIHVALAAGEPPRLHGWQVDEVYRQLGDPAEAKVETHSVRVPGVGFVTMARKRCAIDEHHVWFEWEARAA